jgi:phospholipase D1/2
MHLFCPNHNTFALQHSKMTIVDDSVLLVGSANINQRSLDGCRDSELLLGIWQPNHLATEEKIPEGEVHAFRLHCFARTTNRMEDVFRDPSTVECMRRMNDIAKENWDMYCQDDICEMKSYLVPYPIQVSQENGSVSASTQHGYFPDTAANILGSPGVLPKSLTT